jgi:hypothetical protein
MPPTSLAQDILSDHQELAQLVVFQKKRPYLWSDNLAGTYYLLEDHIFYARIKHTEIDYRLLEKELPTNC